MVDAALDRRAPDLVLDVRGRAGEIHERRPLLVKIGCRHARQRALHVGGEHEPFPLGGIGHGEGDQVAKRRAFDPVRQRRRHAQRKAGFPVDGAVGALDPRHRLERAPPLGRAAGLEPGDHAPRILRQHPAAHVRRRVGAEVIVVVVAHEHERRAGRVRGDPVVRAAERFPLRLARRQGEARRRQRRARIDQDPGRRDLDIGRHRADAERIGGERDDLHVDRPRPTSIVVPVIIAACSTARTVWTRRAGRRDRTRGDLETRTLAPRCRSTTGAAATPRDRDGSERLPARAGPVASPSTRRVRAG